MVLVVRNAEDKVGSAVRRMVQHLRGLDQSFEVLAVNAGSWDTSFAVLRLLAAEVPELRLLDKDVAARVYMRGAAEARGSSVVFMDGRPGADVAGRRWAGRCRAWPAGTEAVVVRGRCIAARRLPALPAIARARGRGELFERSFEREARRAARWRWWARPAASRAGCWRRSGACWPPNRPLGWRDVDPRRSQCARSQTC